MPSIATSPYWAASATLPRFARLDRDAVADVAIVGGGVTGLTAAYLLARAGRQVILLERGRCAGAETGHTSAHLTMVTDQRLGALVTRIGRPHAQAVWDAGLAAIAAVDAIVREHRLDADFAWIDGYLHAPADDDAGREAAEFGREAALANEMGFDAEPVGSVPVFDRPGIRFAGQARVHPRKYLAGLAKAAVGLGVRIHEHSNVDQFERGPVRLQVNGRTVTCADVFIATHVPLTGLASNADAAGLQAKLAQYTTYVVAARVAPGAVPDALWWDTSDPYTYLRTEPHRGYDVVLLGGEDHKTGQEQETPACYRRLEARLARLVPGAEVTHRWSGQVVETPDGLPYIGASAEHQYSATGYAGNGLTFGTLAGMLVADAILERRNPWTALFAPDRTMLARDAWNYARENADYPYYRMRDWFAGPDARSIRAVPRGEGRIIERDGKKVAAYKDPSGAVTLRSAMCPHMGCAVSWNTAERTWDCPCHGSRFTPTGDLIAGPAEAPLDDVG